MSICLSFACSRLHLRCICLAFVVHLLYGCALQLSRICPSHLLCICPAFACICLHLLCIRHAFALGMCFAFVMPLPSAFALHLSCLCPWHVLCICHAFAVVGVLGSVPCRGKRFAKDAVRNCYLPGQYCRLGPRAAFRLMKARFGTAGCISDLCSLAGWSNLTACCGPR